MEGVCNGVCTAKNLNRPDQAVKKRLEKRFKKGGRRRKSFTLLDKPAVAPLKLAGDTARATYLAPKVPAEQ
jgi:hypothetical protein